MTRNRKLIINILPFLILLLGLLAVGYCLYKIFSKEGFVPGSLVPSGSDWIFTPTQNYFGPVSLSYYLTDGFNTSAPNTLNFYVNHVLQTLAASPIFTSPPVLTNSNNIPISYTFNGSQLVSMANLSGGEPNQNIGYIVITNIGQVYSNNSQIPNGTFTTTPNTTLISLLAGSWPTTIQSLITSAGTYPISTQFTYNVPTNYPSPITVSFTYYLVDSNNYGTTLQPNSATLYPAVGPLTLTFNVPWIYQNPVVIPVSLSGPFLENTTFTLTPNQLVGSSIPGPGVQSSLVPIGIYLATCAPNQTMSNNGTCSETTGIILNITYLIVGGGGGGGSITAGGGGAGGFTTGSTSVSTGSSYQITVGAGGSAGTGSGSNGYNGSSSSIISQTFNITMSGGGGGGSLSSNTVASNGLSGASGGGGSVCPTNTTAGGSGGSNISGQGFAGSAGSSNTSSGGGGGGGGASSAGFPVVYTAGNPALYIPTTATGGNGGTGISSNITGSLLYYAGGGGGGSNNGSGSGGSGVGGSGASHISSSNTYVNATIPTANTGSGGGGGLVSVSSASSGASGVVIISYLGPQMANGGIITTNGSYIVHTFNVSGVFSL